MNPSVNLIMGSSSFHGDFSVNLISVGIFQPSWVYRRRRFGFFFSNFFDPTTTGWAFGFAQSREDQRGLGFELVQSVNGKSFSQSISFYIADNFSITFHDKFTIHVYEVPARCTENNFQIVFVDEFKILSI